MGGRARNLDFAGRLYTNDDGEPAISFGKYKGKTAREVYESDPSYFDWIDKGEFTLDTKRQFARLKEQFRREQKQRDAELQKAPASDEALRALQGKYQGRLF